MVLIVGWAYNLGDIFTHFTGITTGKTKTKDFSSLRINQKSTPQTLNSSILIKEYLMIVAIPATVKEFVKKGMEI